MAGFGEVQVVFELHQALPLYHIVVGVSEVDSLLEDGLLAQIDYFSHHRHLYLLHVEVWCFPLCVFDGGQTDIWSNLIYIGCDHSPLVISIPLLPVLRELVMVWIFIGPYCQVQALVFADCSQQFQMV